MNFLFPFSVSLSTHLLYTLLRSQDSYTNKKQEDPLQILFLKTQISARYSQHMFSACVCDEVTQTYFQPQMAQKVDDNEENRRRGLNYY